jgi:hypothetical protein
MKAFLATLIFLVVGISGVYGEVTSSFANDGYFGSTTYDGNNAVSGSIMSAANNVAVTEDIVGPYTKVDQVTAANGATAGINVAVAGASASGKHTFDSSFDATSATYWNNLDVSGATNINAQNTASSAAGDTVANDVIVVGTVNPARLSGFWGYGAGFDQVAFVAHGYQSATGDNIDHDVLATSGTQTARTDLDYDIAVGGTPAIGSNVVEYGMSGAGGNAAAVILGGSQVNPTAATDFDIATTNGVLPAVIANAVLDQATGTSAISPNAAVWPTVAYAGTTQELVQTQMNMRQATNMNANAFATGASPFNTFTSFGSYSMATVSYTGTSASQSRAFVSKTAI